MLVLRHPFAGHALSLGDLVEGAELGELDSDKHDLLRICIALIGSLAEPI